MVGFLHFFNDWYPYAYWRWRAVELEVEGQNGKNSYSTRTKPNSGWDSSFKNLIWNLPEIRDTPETLTVPKVPLPILINGHREKAMAWACRACMYNVHACREACQVKALRHVATEIAHHEISRYQPVLLLISQVQYNTYILGASAKKAHDTL